MTSPLPGKRPWVAILAIGRYSLVERFSVGLVILFTLSTIFALGALQLTEFKVTTANIVEGLQFKLPANFSAAFAALGIIGVGAAELILLPLLVSRKRLRRPGWSSR